MYLNFAIKSEGKKYWYILGPLSGRSNSVKFFVSYLTKTFSVHCTQCTEMYIVYNVPNKHRNAEKLISIRGNKTIPNETTT